MKKVIYLLTLTMLINLAACGENPDGAYNRGYDDGWADVCYQIERYNREMYESLQRKQIC